MAVPVTEKTLLQQGFGRVLSGTTMTYDSPLPEIRTALICRATDGKSAITWESQPIEIPPGAKQVGLIWLAGLGSNIGAKNFYLQVNGAQVLSFSTSNSDSWEVMGKKGVKLTFVTTMVDRYKDRFGFMQLFLPMKMVQAGVPVKLSITGEAAGSTAWVMTFTSAISEGISVSSPGVVLKDQGREAQPLRLDILHLGAPTTATIRMEGTAPEQLPINFGISHHTLKLAPVTEEKTLNLNVEMDGATKNLPVTVKPVRPWTVYLVQHTHTDIGYTRPQTEILAEHLRYIDYALDYCDQTDHYPDAAQFRWTCETSWAVREYLKTRPASQIARFKQRVQEGRIEVTGMLLNWSEVADENMMLQSLEPIQEFRALGLPVLTAMQDDVNGYAWCLVDYFHDLGVKYVTSGINTHRAMKPFQAPTPFWWESPSGKRVLAFRADHYMTGNFFGVASEEFENIARDLPAYLRQIEENGYPFSATSVQFSGYFTDNSPPSTIACDVIKRWNETYTWPKLRSATVHEFLAWLEQEHGSELQTFRAAWPDWWTDGYGCAMRETAIGRLTQSDLLVNQGLLAMARILGAQLPPTIFQQMTALVDNLHFYNEHTFGAAESISDPLAENSQVQWAEKSSYVWQAAMQSRLLREAAMGQLQSFLNPAEVPTIVVFNTLNWSRAGLHVLYIDDQILPREFSFRIVDAAGQSIPVQLAQSRAEGSYWALWLNDVPALGYNTYRILSDKRPRPAEPEFLPSADAMENAYYRLKIDRKNGALASLYDKELNIELLDPSRQWQLAQFIYEKLASRRPMEEHRLGDYTRTSLTKIKVKPGVDGPIWQSLILTGASDGFVGAEGVSCEVRLFKTAKRLDLIFKGRKSAVSDPEAVYVAFPFALDQGQLHFEAQGGMVQPGENQLPGTASDWNTVQNFAALRSPDAQIVLVSDEIPLMQFGGINTGRYQYEAKPASQQIFSWVLNNYWTTNFRADQEGDITWSYALTSSRDASNTFASHFGWGARVPFVSRVLPAAPTPVTGTLSRTIWPFKPATVLLVSTRPADQGIILHLREVAGQPATLILSDPAGNWKLEQVDGLGQSLRSLTEAQFQPNEVKFLRIWQ